LEDLFLLNNNIGKYEKIIIYGAGIAGRSLLLELLQRNVKVECFADSNPDRCGERFYNKPVIHIDELLDERERAAVIVSGIYAFEVAAQLERLGFLNIFNYYYFGDGEGAIHLARKDG